MPADTKGLVADRRQLLEHVIRAFELHGGRVQLPVGMTAAEPWLLDSVDVSALLPVLRAAGQGSNAPAIELFAFCQKGARGITADSTTQSRVSSRRTSEAAGQELAVPQLQLPQLQTGLSEDAIKDLAYLVFASNCPHEADLLSSVRSQLGIDEARAAEVQRLLGLLHSAMREHAGPLPVSKTWTASLELPVCLLGVVLPRDFRRFGSFVMWRDTLSHVLLATLAHSVKEGWCGEQQQQQQQRLPHSSRLDQDQQLQLQSEGSGQIGTAQQLMARLKAALRRLDVRDADDFDEAEYRAASAAVRQHTQAIVQCTAAGWSFPWGLRVRLYEVLLRALFDSLDEQEYVADKDRYLQVLEANVQPVLGIVPLLHAAMLAWVHFRQYVITQAPQLLAETRSLLYKLASITVGEAEREAGVKAAAAAAFGAAASTGAGAAASATAAQVAAHSAAAAGKGTAGGPCSQQDAVVARNVGQAVVDWILDKLSDYHQKLEPLGGPSSMAGLVDLLAFASTCRGASDEEVSRALLEAVSLSTAAELQRRLSSAGGASEEASEAARCAEVCRTVSDLVSEEHTWTSGFTNQLPEAFSVALAVLQEAAGAVLMPWLASQPVLDEDTCAALRCALELEPRIMKPIRVTAADRCRYACTARLFGSVKPWNMQAQLQPLLSAWLEMQMSSFGVWVDRQLQQEDWKPLGTEQAHCASARELRRIAMESLEALFGLQLPLPPATVRLYMQGIAGMMTRYLDAILTLLGSEAVMIPPTPHLTRYKREVAVKQEDAESQLPGMPTQQPPASATSRKGIHFADSVRRVEDEPCAARVSGLTSPVLVVMMASLAYLMETLQLLATTVKQMRQQEREARVSSSGGPGPASPYNGSASAGSPVNNPFLTGNDDPDDGIGGLGALSGFDAGGQRYSSSAGGGNSPAWSAGRPPLQQPPQQQQLNGLRWRDASGTGWSSEGGAGGSLGQGSGAGSCGWGAREEQLGSLHDTGQKLRAGLASVARWLAVRVVWWEQRPGWCELLYRHRVASCRIEWLLEGLAGVLQDHASVLPKDLYNAVASELLQQAALALERVLIDGGPCRWFIPADVDHLREDVDSLKSLFFQAGVAMQDIRTALQGLDGVLKLMQRQTGPLIEAHRAARRAALLAGPAAPTTPPSAAAAAAAGTAAGFNYSTGSNHSRVSAPGGSTGASSAQGLGPLAAAKLANAAQGSSAAAAGTAALGGASSGSPHHSRHPTNGSIGGTFDDAASYSSYGSSSPSWAAMQATGKGVSGAGTGAAGALGGIGCMRRTAMDVAAAGGNVEAQEPILLRVLCHRADHAASKYLKDNMKVPKVRDETIKETLGRFTRLNRI